MIWLTGITGTVLALVSIACSAILWSSYAISTLDTVIASATAAALVLCQYLFFINARHHSGSVKHAHTAAVAVLFITSCAATIGWLESRYQANSRTDLQADSTYTTQQATQQQRLADLAVSIQKLHELAAADAENGYRSRAARLLADAEQQDETRARILRELNTYTTTAGNAGTALANGLSGWRWLLWALLALLVDLCPMLCFAHVARTVTPAQRIRETPVTTQREAVQQLAATPETADSLTDTIAAEIADGTHGEMPAIRRVMVAHNLRHDRASAIFNTLEQRGVIARQGNRFQRIPA